MQKNEEAIAAGGTTRLLFSSGSQINKHFNLKQLISIGGFGQVYSGKNINTDELVAIKAESIDAKIPLLRIEATCLEALNHAIRQNYRKPPREPIPNYYGYGETHNVRYMVMDLCGKNMRELKKSMKEDCFTITTSLWLMKKMILALKFLHRLGWIHRDVKPANFCVGLHTEGKQELYLVDFGMARHFIARNGVMKTRRESSAFHGTVRYASLTTHRHQASSDSKLFRSFIFTVEEHFTVLNRKLSYDMSRYDDLWSVYYISVENMVGQLPWRYVNEKSEVEKMKENIDLLRQKYGTEPNPPASLVVLHRHLSHASFYQEPEYHHIVNEIDLDLTQRNFTADSRLDWQPPQKPSERITSNDFEEKNRRELLVSCDHNNTNHNRNYPVFNHNALAANDDRSYYFMQSCDNF
uniref:Protein kinase domain-containing protein n=1 Tax=Setaria digitata TaxID=48799 RepID=A0A915PJ95_9BILA